MAERCLLYYITDRKQFRGDERERRRTLLAKVAEAAAAHVDAIQLREKDLSARELESLAREAMAIVRESSRSTRLLINSRTDVAVAIGADGVHLRTDDIGPNEVRRVFGMVGPEGLKPSFSPVSGVTTEVVPFSNPAPRERREGSTHRPPGAEHFLVAVSCHSNGDVVRAESEAADFAVFAPVFEKRDAEKKDAPGARATGLAALREACRAKMPVFALGGVTLGNAASCLEAGAAGIAAIRLFQENRIEDVVRALRAL